jgi:hypothetical protein
VGTRTGLDDVERRIFCSYQDSNSGLSAVQTVISRYTDCATPDVVFSFRSEVSLARPTIICSSFLPCYME